MDLLFVLCALAFFVVAVLYVAACARLGGDR